MATITCSVDERGRSCGFDNEMFNNVAPKTADYPLGLPEYLVLCVCKDGYTVPGPWYLPRDLRAPYSLTVAVGELISQG